MNALIQRASNAFAALPPARRYALLAGWVVVLTLLLVLIGRPLLAWGKDLRQWPLLAQQAQALSPGPTFTAEYWQALAGARGLVLTRVEQRGDIWQLQGELSRAEPLAQLMRSIQEQGGRPLRWSLEQGHQSLVFSLDVGRAGRLP
ncbi:type II secretion system protein GspM [Pseudomonas cichorii]|uniref:type II secretion system protein GspM n=1 Tax=Pseudomonas cichorii TaxID=36746 RepID=UPI001C89E872|nr:type II secretion system protein GspM [Pseudomonas cichorii]MBX8532772.1 type II secretion system protein GspM [Pseudomonas cichorii]